MNITEFLEARIAEDAAAALAAASETEYSAPRWEHPQESGDVRVAGGGSLMDYADLDDSAAEHIARHDPARVLAECAAKREIIKLHEAYEIFKWNPQGHCRECSDSGWDAAVDGASPEDFPCPTIRAVLSVYSGHPDYQASWLLV